MARDHTAQLGPIKLTVLRGPPVGWLNGLARTAIHDMAEILGRPSADG